MRAGMKKAAIRPPRGEGLPGRGPFAAKPLHQDLSAPDALATCVAMASISGGDRQS